MGSDRFLIDSNKLRYHSDRVNELLSTGDTRPIYSEVSLTRRCNAKCNFCAYGNLDRKESILEEDIFYKAFMSNVIPYIGEFGIRSIMFGGEGEPLLNKNILELTIALHEANVDTALTTNGLILYKYSELLKYMTWVKVSIDAGTSNTFSKIKSLPEHSFDHLVYDLRYLSGIDNRCTLGAQMILLPDNYTEVGVLANICKDIGLDYLVIKPYTRHEYTSTSYDSIYYDEMIDRVRDDISTIDYNVIFRANAFSYVSDSIGYNRCLALPFWINIMANGDVYPCSAYYGNDEYIIGNIIHSDILDIWYSSKRIEVYDTINSDMKLCRNACRMNASNLYLYDLLDNNISEVDRAEGDIPDHVNFI